MPKVIRYEDFSNVSDTAFRTWVLSAETMLAAAGMVRTADTGQIDPGAVTRPATNAYAGYSVWRLNDPLQSVAPIFLKLQYGVGNSVANAALFVEIGSGSNGSGSLTGAVSGSRVFVTSNVNVTNSINLAVANDWGAALLLGMAPGSVSALGNGMGFAVHRTVDPEGSPTSEGAMLNLGGSSSNSGAQVGQVFFSQRVPAEVILSMPGTEVSQTPFSLAGYSVGVSPQIFPLWCAIPRVKPMAFLGVAPATSSPSAGQTFQMAIVGAQPRTYMSIGSSIGRHFYNASSPAANSFILWED